MCQRNYNNKQNKHALRVSICQQKEDKTEINLSNAYKYDMNNYNDIWCKWTYIWMYVCVGRVRISLMMCMALEHDKY